MAYYDRSPRFGRPGAWRNGGKTGVTGDLSGSTTGQGIMTR